MTDHITTPEQMREAAAQLADLLSGSLMDQHNEAKEYGIFGHGYLRSASDDVLRLAAAIRAIPVAQQPIWPDFIAPRKYDNPDPRWIDPALPDFRLIWKVARECGYAVGLHGSMKRDCDLIAVPWTDEAVLAFDLIACLCKALNAQVLGPVAGKPHGRLGWNLQVDGYVKVIDISVVPRSQDRTAPDIKHIGTGLYETQSDYRLAPHLQRIAEAAKTAPQWDTVNDRMAPQPVAVTVKPLPYGAEELDAALAEYTPGIDRAVRFVTIDQVDALAEFYLQNRNATPARDVRAAALREAAAAIHPEIPRGEWTEQDEAEAELAGIILAMIDKEPQP